MPSLNSGRNLIEGPEHVKEFSRQRYVAGVGGILGNVISAAIGLPTIGFLASPRLKKPLTDTSECH